MHSIRNLLSMRAALGVLTLASAMACGDAPSAPSKTAPSAAQSASALTGATRVVRRDVRAANGVLYTVESVVRADGMPAEVRVYKDGAPFATLTNEWQRAGSGFVLQQQKMVRFDAAGAAATFDTHAAGGVASMMAMPPSVDGVDSVGYRRASSQRAAYSELDWYGGPCDAQARAVQSAIEDWVLSVAAMGGAAFTGNAYMAWSAYAYQLKKYRDVVRAESALDQCVADAGKPPEFF